MTAVAHWRWQRYVDAFVDGELGGRRRRRVAWHVARCPMCLGDALITVHIKASLARTAPAR